MDKETPTKGVYFCQGHFVHDDYRVREWYDPILEDVRSLKNLPTWKRLLHAVRPAWKDRIDKASASELFGMWLEVRNARRECGFDLTSRMYRKFKEMPVGKGFVYCPKCFNEILVVKDKSYAG